MHGPLDLDLPWEDFFHSFKPSPTLTLPSRSLLVLKKSNLDIERLRSFNSSFQHFLTSAAQQERSKYPETLKLKKLYSRMQEEIFPLLNVHVSTVLGMGTSPSTMFFPRSIQIIGRTRKKLKNRVDTYNILYRKKTLIPSYYWLLLMLNVVRLILMTVGDQAAMGFVPS